jgi:monoamine oxidase
VRISVVQSGMQHQMEADRAVLALPFSVLRRVPLDSSISAGKRQAISKLQYESILRVYLQFRERFWLGKVSSGIAYTDSGIGMVLDHTSSQRASRGILEAQLEGSKAHSASMLKADERVRWVATQMEQIHPGARGSVEGGISFSWDHDPWSLGAWVYYAPGQMEAHFPHVATAEGRIHFAGEHTSSLPGTLEGAIDSGRRVTREILQTA